MKKIITIAVFIMFAGCGDSTGPSQVIRDQLVVINTSTGGITETVNLATSGCYETEFSSDGNFLYIIDRMNLISKLDLNSMVVEREQFMPGNGIFLIHSALSGNDSLLFVLDSNEKLYKITTSDMTIADTLTLDFYTINNIETRPGTDLLYFTSNDA